MELLYKLSFMWVYCCSSFSRGLSSVNFTCNKYEFKRIITLLFAGTLRIGTKTLFLNYILQWHFLLKR
jgi:hypothetical protein